MVTVSFTTEQTGLSLICQRKTRQKLIESPEAKLLVLIILILERTVFSTTGQYGQNFICLGHPKRTLSESMATISLVPIRAYPGPIAFSSMERLGLSLIYLD